MQESSLLFCLHEVSRIRHVARHHGTMPKTLRTEEHEPRDIGSDHERVERVVHP